MFQNVYRRLSTVTNVETPIFLRAKHPEGRSVFSPGRVCQHCNLAFLINHYCWFDFLFCCVLFVFEQARDTYTVFYTIWIIKLYIIIANEQNGNSHCTPKFQWSWDHKKAYIWLYRAVCGSSPLKKITLYPCWQW